MSTPSSSTRSQPVRAVAPESPAEAALRESNELLRALSQAQSAFLVEGNPRDTFDRLLGELLRLTRSEYGFVGEIFTRPDGKPYLKAHAITDISWDEASRAFFEKHAPSGLEFTRLDSLFGSVMTTRAPVIANAPASDPRRGGLPHGHPPLRAFLGLPFERHGQMIGMVGLANRPGGYDDDLIHKLEPFLATCAALTEAFRIERRRQQAERSLRESEDRLRVAMAAADIGTWHCNGDDAPALISDRTRELYGLAPDEAIDAARFLTEVVHPDDRARVAAAAERALATGGDYDVEYRVVLPGGATRWLAARGRAHRHDGAPPRLEGVVLDIGERKRAAEAVADSERKFRTLFETGNDAIIILKGGRCVECNGRTLGMFAATRDALVGGDAPFPADDGATPRRFEQRLRRADGTDFDAEISLHPVELHGEPHVQAVIRDVTERKIAERELRDARAHLVAAMAAGGIGVWSMDLVTGEGRWDESVARLYGFPPTEPLVGDPSRFVPRIHPDDRERVRDAFRRTVADGCDYDVEYRVLHPGGAVRWMAAKGRVERDAGGLPARLVGACVDIDERKQLEAQLLHAQKMEAIGRLAGGVAHDFNNLLTVIQGHAALLRRHVSGEEPAEWVEEIAAAAERAANLTRQLLAFSRRQHLQLRPVSLNDIIGEMTRMLRRIVGEDIRFTVELAPGLPAVDADAGMIQQVLLNLAVNARDAMPGGGELTVRTAPAGRSVVVGVADTGCGIAPEHLPHIFEPFFTTKDIGKGTGLGLATVYGIVKQHGGEVRVDSAPGRGSVFEVILPASARIGADPRGGRAAPRTSPAGHETVLVVEDEAPLRRLITRVLLRAGYDVVEAASGVEALRAWDARGSGVRLLVTDLVMPDGISGRDLAARLRAAAPGLPVIFTSGYSAEVLGDEGALPADAVFMQKPFEPEELLVAVRRQLDR